MFPLAVDRSSNAIEAGPVEPALKTIPQPSQKQVDLVFDYLSPLPRTSVHSQRISSCSYSRDALRERTVPGRERGGASNVTSSHLDRDEVWDLSLAHDGPSGQCMTAPNQ